MDISPFVHNATYYHDVVFESAVDYENILFQKVPVTYVRTFIAPSGCNDLQERIHSIQERMRFQMSVGFNVGRCIRFFADRVVDKVVSLRECLTHQMTDLKTSQSLMKSMCKQKTMASHTN